MKRILGILAAILIAGPSLAQTSPGFTSGQVLTAAALNTAFQAKLNYPLATQAAAILSSHATAGVGYTTGAGGTVTQITSRTTGVTLNKASGSITLVSAAGSAAWQSFTVTNSAVAATDTVVVSQKSGADKHLFLVTAVGAGSFEISFASAVGTTTEQPVINFAVIKGAAS